MPAERALATELVSAITADFFLLDFVRLTVSSLDFSCRTELDASFCVTLLSTAFRVGAFAIVLEEVAHGKGSI